MRPNVWLLGSQTSFCFVMFCVVLRLCSKPASDFRGLYIKPSFKVRKDIGTKNDCMTEMGVGIVLSNIYLGGPVSPGTLRHWPSALPQVGLLHTPPSHLAPSAQGSKYNSV